ncbi:hypothetical protein DFJ73DRAFT_965487 [Zopfochytrium polystomum]|nr:hypothetical protein DFJ73DRAFT_965487 [Zopfochytrium polystomum]
MESNSLSVNPDGQVQDPADRPPPSIYLNAGEEVHGTHRPRSLSSFLPAPLPTPQPAGSTPRRRVSMKEKGSFASKTYTWSTQATTSNSSQASKSIREDDDRGGGQRRSASSSPPNPTAEAATHSTEENSDEFSVHKPADEIMKEFRWLRALSKRHERITERLENFWRIQVEVDNPRVSFFVIAEKRITINQLIHLIEAEYAYKFVLPPRDENGEYDADPSAQPLQCGLLYDSAMNSLRFDDRVEAVLDFDETIHAMNVFSDYSQFSGCSPASGLSFSLNVDTVDGPDGANETPLTKVMRRSSQLPPELPAQISEDSPAIDSATTDFVPEVCCHKPEAPDTETASTSVVILPRRPCSPKRSPTVASRSPTLDDRFRSQFRNRAALQRFQEFCVEDKTVENLMFWLEVEILQSCPDELQLIYGQYLYYIYLAPTAPLRINVCEEVLTDTTCPNGEKVLDQIVFDEAQHHIYTMLKGHSFVKFERNANLHSPLKEEDDVLAKADMLGSFFEELKPNIDLVKGLLEKYGPRLKTPPGMADKNSVLNDVLQALFPSSRHYPLENYFSDSVRRSRAHRRFRILKEKKISKFFGRRPSFDQLQRQYSTHTGHISLELRDVPGAGGAEISELGARRRKLEKLTEFFGQNLGDSELRRQHLAFQHEPPSPQFVDGGGDELQPLDTRNDLDPEEKKRLARQIKKLALLTGENVTPDYRPSRPIARSAASLEEAEESLEETVKREIDEYLKELLKDDSREGAAASSDSQKQARRKKLSKLSSILGENAGAVETAEAEEGRKGLELAASNRILTKEERQRQIRRATKLEKVMGQVVPSTMLAVQTKPIVTMSDMSFPEEFVVTVENVKQSPTSALLPQPEEAGKDLESLSTPEIERERRLSTSSLVTHEIATGKSVGVLSPTASSGKRPSSVCSLRHRNNIHRISVLLSEAKVEKVIDLMDQMMDADLDLEQQPSSTKQQKSQRQKKLMKLHKFFGSRLDAAQLFEQNIVASIAQMIEADVDDPSELAELRVDLANLRGKIEGRKEDLNAELRRRVLREAENLSP